jgi:arylsulfatase A-like enzyme
VQFRIFGVPVRVSTAFWLTALFFGITQRSGVLVVATVVVVFVAVLTHELGHALTARAFGAEPEITLHGFGGTTRYVGTGFGRAKSIATTFAGPFAGFLLGVATVVATRYAPPASPEGARIRETLLFCSFGWSVLNLLPVLPFDGGLILQHALGPKRLRAALWLSTLFGVLVMAAALKLRIHWLTLVFFGMATFQSARAAWSFGDVQAELRQRDEAAARALEAARAAAARGAHVEAEARASEALGAASDPVLRDGARRVLAGAALEKGDGFRALSVLGAVEVGADDDDVLRAQALDLLGEREAAFGLLERRASERPSGPALGALVRGLLATGQVSRAAALGEQHAQRGELEELSALATELHERGQFQEATALSRSLLSRTGDGRFGYLAARACARQGDHGAALDALESAVGAGFDDLEQLRGEGDFGSLRDEPRFDRLLEGLRAGHGASLGSSSPTSMARPTLSVLSRLARPELAGAAYMLATVAFVGYRAAADSRVGGVEASHVTQAISAHFAHHVVRVTHLLMALAVLFGLALGAAAGVLVRLRAALGGERQPEGLRLLGAATPVLVALHAASLLHGMAVRPQLYEESFYGAGGVRRLVQLACTDLLGPGGVLALTAAAVVAYLVGGPRRWPAVAAAVRALAGNRRAAGAAAGSGAIVALVVAGLLVERMPGVAASPRQPGGISSGKPNVLILAADSLRPDRITPATAPRLAALAEQAVVFERTYVSLPRTFPSWVTLLTGRHPHHHGVRNMFPSRAARERDFDALPRRLGAAGYATSVVSDYAGDIFPRVELGFERVDAPSFHLGEVIRQRAIEPQVPLFPLLDSRAGRALVPSMLGLSRAPDARGVVRRTLSAIDGAGGRPFFVVGFFSTTHFPYAAPSPGYGRHTDPAYRGRFKYEKVNLLGREVPPDEADIRQIRGLYDGAVGVVDEAIGQVIDGLRARGLDRSTIVIITADHGETLFESGRGHGHGDHLFGEEALRTPLMVIDGRGTRPRRVPGVARSIDLAPTIYALASVDPPGDLDGASLVPQLAGEPLPPRTAFAETGLWFTEDVGGVPAELRLPYPDISRMGEIVRDAGDDVVLQDTYFPLTLMAKHRAIITADRKFVLAPTRQGLRGLLFDLAADPACMHDIAQQEPEAAAKLRASLLDWVLEDPRMELRGQHLVPRASAVRPTAKRGDTFRLEGP